MKKERTSSVIAILLTICLMMSCSTLMASALHKHEYAFPEGTKFISNFGCSIKKTVGEQNTAKRILRDAGLTVLDQDLNDGCGALSNFIFMGYKTSESYKDAIHGIRFLHLQDNKKPDTVTQFIDGHNVEFRLVGGSKEPKLTEGLADPLDLNKGAGEGSDYIYMYISRDPIAGPPITAVNINTTEVESGWNTAGRINNPEKSSDLNANVGDKEIYLHYKSENISGPLDSTELRRVYNLSSELLENPNNYVSTRDLTTVNLSGKEILNILDGGFPKVVTQEEINIVASNISKEINNLKTYLYFNASHNGGSCETDKIVVNIGADNTIDVDVSSYKAIKGAWDFLGWSNCENDTTGSNTILNVGFNDTVYALFRKGFNADFTYLSNDGEKITESKNAVAYNSDFYGELKSPQPDLEVSYHGKTLKLEGFRNDDAIIEPTYSVGNLFLNSNIDYKFNSIYSGQVEINFLPDGAENIPESVKGDILYSVGDTIENNTVDLTISDKIPTKFGYTFKGWATSETPETLSYIPGATLRKLNKDVTLIPLWNKNYYNVKFINEDGSVLQNSDLPYLTLPIYSGETPTKDSSIAEDFTFSGWDKEISEIVNDVVYKARFNSSPRKYPVTFKNYDGTEILKTEFEFGAIPFYEGITPVKPGSSEIDYEFIGWNKEFTTIDGSQEYIAMFSEKTRLYAITFLDYDGETVLDEQYLPYGTTEINYNGETPYRGPSAKYIYTFLKWTPEFKEVTCNAKYKALYSSTLRTYKITFVDEEGNILQEENVEYGKRPEYIGETPLKDKDEKYIYHFNGWDRELEAVKGEAVYTVNFTKTFRRYNVTFYNENGSTVLQSNDIPYGVLPSYVNPTPTKAPVDGVPYIFTGWNKEFSPVTSDAVYIAQFAPDTRVYNIKFVNYNGEILQEQELSAGTLPQFIGDDPIKPSDEKYAYFFTGWNKNIEIATADEIYTAVYSKRKNSFTIKFLNEDGTVLQVKTYKKGEMPVLECEEPTKTANATYHYEFNGWDKELTSVDSNKTYIVKFKALEHNFELVSITAPSCTADGKAIYKCSCGYTYEQIEPCLGHDYHYVVEGEKAYKKCSRCGDKIEVPMQEAEEDPETGRCPYCGRYHRQYLLPDFGRIGCVISRILEYFAELFKGFNG